MHYRLLLAPLAPRGASLEGSLSIINLLQISLSLAFDLIIPLAQSDCIRGCCKGLPVVLPWTLLGGEGAQPFTWTLGPWFKVAGGGERVHLASQQSVGDPWVVVSYVHPPYMDDFDTQRWTLGWTLLCLGFLALVLAAVIMTSLAFLALYLMSVLANMTLGPVGC